jgi:hypothetical protein
VGQDRVRDSCPRHKPDKSYQQWDAERPKAA